MPFTYIHLVLSIVVIPLENIMLLREASSAVLVPQRELTHVLNILVLIIEGYALYFNDNSLSVYR